MDMKSEEKYTPERYTVCKEDSYMEWLRNLSAAIDYIEQNLDGEISYDEAALIACCSTFYFQRLFSYIAGIPLSEYIRRRRMTQAAFDLQRTGAKVIDVALKYGYTSPTAFNRAFQSVHHITPNAAKRNGSKLNAYPVLRFKVSIAGETAMPYRIEKKPPIRMIGVRTPLVENMEENQKHIPLFWTDVLNSNRFSDIYSLADQMPHEILGVSIYEDPQKFFYYIASASNRPVPSGMFAYEIPSSEWVVFENDGNFKEDVQNVFKRFFTEWLPFSGYEYACLPDIEVYPVYQEVPTKGHSEVWIAIKKCEEKR